MNSFKHDALANDSSRISAITEAVDVCVASACTVSSVSASFSWLSPSALPQNVRTTVLPDRAILATRYAVSPTKNHVSTLALTHASVFDAGARRTYMCDQCDGRRADRETREAFAPREACAKVTKPE